MNARRLTKHAVEATVEFETTATAAEAKVACRIDNHVAEFTSTAGLASNNFATYNARASDAGIDFEVNEMVETYCGAPRHFSYGGAIIFVVGEYGQIEGGLERTAYVRARPSWNHACPQDLTGVRAYRTWHRNTDTEHRLTSNVTFLADIFHQHVRGLRRGLR